MIQEFEEWQRNRQYEMFDEDIEMGQEVSLSIFKPKEKCTIVMNIPYNELKDHGDQIKLQWEVKKILK